MAQEYKIPTLKGLNPKKPDYPERIDEGLRAIDMVRRAIRLEYQTALKEADVVGFFQERGVSVVQDSETIDSFHMGSVTGIDSLLTQAVRLEDPTDVNQRILAESLYQEYFAHVAQRFEPLLDLEARANQANQDFTKAAGKLTDVRSLNITNPKYQNAQFYLIRDERVYKADLINGALKIPYSGGELISEENLTPEMFSDDNFLEGFTLMSNENRTNYYLLTNSLVEFTVRDIFIIGADNAYIQILKKRNKSIVSKITKSVQKKGKNILSRITGNN